MKNTQGENIKLRTNKAEKPKEMVLIQHIDSNFSLPLWLPLTGLVLGIIGEIILFFKDLKLKD